MSQFSDKFVNILIKNTRINKTNYNFVKVGPVDSVEYVFSGYP